MGVEDYIIEDALDSAYTIRKGDKEFYARIVRFVKRGERLMFIVEPVIKKRVWKDWPFTFEEWVYDEKAMGDEVARIINAA